MASARSPTQRDPQRAQLGRAEGEQPPLGQLVGEVVGQAGAGVVAVRVGADDDDLGVRVGAADGLRGRDGRRPSADEHVAAGRRGPAALPPGASPPPCRPGASARSRERRGHPSGDRRVHRLEVQQPPRAALGALAAGQAAAVADRLAAPGVAAHVEPHRAVERAHAALHAPARLGHDPRARQRPVLLSVGGEEPHGTHGSGLRRRVAACGCQRLPPRFNAGEVRLSGGRAGRRRAARRVPRPARRRCAPPSRLRGRPRAPRRSRAGRSSTWRGRAACPP